MKRASIGSVRFGRAAFVATAALCIIAATRAWAGGFWFTVEAPAERKDPRIKDAALVVRTYLCGEPGSARINARAEGIVDGQRKSITLAVTEAKPGVYTVRREWPSKGDWVIAISGADHGLICSKLVELGPNGNLSEKQQVCMCPKCFPWRESEGLKLNGESKLAVTTKYRLFTPQEINAKLKSLEGDLAHAGTSN
jgi:hypothetical protein